MAELDSQGNKDVSHSESDMQKKNTRNAVTKTAGSVENQCSG